MNMKEIIKNKRIAIVVVLYNASLRLPDLLKSLKDLNYPTNLIEFIFVDNNSQDNSVELVKSSLIDVKIIENKKNLGFAKANNQAYELAIKMGVDYLFLLNDDTIIDENCLNHLVELLVSDSKIAGVQAKLLLHPEINLINSYGNSLNFLGFAYCNFYRKNNKIGKPFEVPYLSGGACLLKIDVLDKIDLFDDSFFMYHEDVDLGWRLRLMGYKLFFNPEAVVYHKYSFKNSKLKYYFLERNRLIVLLTNYKLLTIFFLLPMIILMEMGMWFFAFYNGWLKEKFLGYWWIIRNIRKIFKKRNILQKNRVLKDREILSLMIFKVDFEDINNFLLDCIANPIMFFYFNFIKLIIFW